MQISRPSIEPPNFIDPITWDVMLDPVVGSDGHTYDRTTARKLDISPFTREPLAILVDNVDLRCSIFEARPDLARRYAEEIRPKAAREPPSPPEMPHGMIVENARVARSSPTACWLSLEEFDSILRAFGMGPGWRRVLVPQDLAKLNELVYANPASAWPLIWRGDYFRSLRVYGQAVADYEKAYSVNPCWNVSLGLARCEYEQGKPEQALVRVSRIPSQSIERWRLTEAYILKGHCFSALGDYANARSNYEEALRVRRDDLEAASAYAGLAVVCTREGDTAAATAYEKRRNLLLEWLTLWAQSVPSLL